MKRTVPAAAAVLLGAPLIALSFVSPAGAAPADVTMSATGGSSVSITFANNSAAEVQCGWWLTSDSNTANSALGNSGQVQNVAPGTSKSATTTLTSGAYHVAWVCTSPSTGESWGTVGRSTTVTAQATAVSITGGSPIDAIGKLFGSS